MCFKNGKLFYNVICECGYSSIVSFNIFVRKLVRIVWGVFKSGWDFDLVMLKVG